MPVSTNSNITCVDHSLNGRHGTTLIQRPSRGAMMGMAEPESTDTAPSRRSLPSPGCLFAVTLLVALASVCFWVGWRVHQQQARLEYFEQLGGRVETEPARPVWLHDLVVATLGEEQAAGFTSITVIGLDEMRVTDAELQHLNGLTSLQYLYLNAPRQEIMYVGASG